MSLVLSWTSKLGRCLIRQSKRSCSEATTEKAISDKPSTGLRTRGSTKEQRSRGGRVERGSLRRDCDTLTVTIPAVTPTFSSPSHPAASPEVPRDTSSGHMPLGSHVIHPRAPSSRPMPRDPVSRPRWVRLRESPPSTPDAPDEPESSTDPRIDSAVLTEDLSI